MTDDYKVGNKQFPKDFLFGTAISAHQVEGNNQYSDWWHWEKNKKLLERSGIACDHYSCFENDFKLAKDVLHNNSYRQSIEWARIEPQKGKINQRQIRHYLKVLKKLKEMGFSTIVTLHHFTNPNWFTNEGGFTKSENIIYFNNYTRICVEKFGDYIDFWIIINEPNIYAFMAFFLGIWPPQQKSTVLTLRVLLNLAKAHKAAYKLIHTKYPFSKVSSAIQMTYFKAKGKLNKLIATFESFLANDLFITFTQKYHDFIAINYYTLHESSLKDIRINKFNVDEIGIAFDGEKNDLGWPSYPQGIYHVVNNAWQKYKLPILITENGIADHDDSRRSNYIVDHLRWIFKAMNEGVNVIGYTYWTLMDNFEWHNGRKAKFGLFETNYKTLERVARKSAHVYGEICRTGILPS